MMGGQGFPTGICLRHAAVVKTGKSADVTRRNRMAKNTSSESIDETAFQALEEALKIDFDEDQPRAKPAPRAPAAARAPEAPKQRSAPPRREAPPEPQRAAAAE